MNDPFEKAHLIRQGKLDHERPSYEELTGWIQRMPVTMLPGILRAAVFQCVIQEVFNPGKLQTYVAEVEKQAEDPNRMLR